MKSTQKMLIAHPDQRYRSALRRWFEKRGHDVVTVDSGIGCVEALRDETPDVLVLHQSLLWGGADGVLEIMRQDGMTGVSVVMVREIAFSSERKRQAAHAGFRNITPFAAHVSGYDVFA